MGSRSSNSIIFPFEWTVKSTTYKIRYRKAFDINVVDESFCSIISARNGQIRKVDFGEILGFYFQDLAEKEIFDIYLKGLKEYNLIEIDNETITLTEFGKEALTSKLKYKYFYASAQLCENQTADGEAIDFSFKDAFGIKYNPNEISETKNFRPAETPNLQSKLQFQLFENSIYKGEVVEIIEKSDPQYSYRPFELQCKITFLESGFQINFYRNDSRIDSLDQLIEKPQNNNLRGELIRQGKFHLILAYNDTITVENLRTYTDLCDWQVLAENPNVDWNDRETFELFKKNGDGDNWKQLSENVPVENIRAVIEDFEDFWNWAVLSRRLDDSFIKDNINRFNWDFEELSYRDTEFVIALLSNPILKERDWDWNYLSQNLPDEFIEENILNFNWDFYVITTTKNAVFKNVFRKHSKDLKSISEKQWNWKYISEKININFLFKNIEGLASKIVWPIVLNRFFNDEKIIVKCLNDDNFKTLLKISLPDHYRISDQMFLWSLELIDFLEELNLINWETKPYIKGLDTNQDIKWDKKTFAKYHDKITTEKGFGNVSKLISDSSLIDEFPDFSWNWKSISTNKALFDSVDFVEKAFSGQASFTDELLWDEIILQSSLNTGFWKRHLEAFYNSTKREKHSRFWELLTQQEKPEFIFSKPHFPWDWSFITDTTSIETILDSLENEDLINKWDWKVATRKLDKGTILENLEDLTHYIDWSFVINEVFTVENELHIDNQLPIIAACLSVLEVEKRKECWRELTSVYPFPQLFKYVTGTHKLKVFEWNWDMISKHHHFPTDLRTLNRFKTNLNWHIFSGSKAILQKFDFDNWDGFGEWFNSADSYLTSFSNYWDWKVLSQNKDLTFNGAIVEKFKDEDWDWEYLSEHGGFLKKPKKDENLQSLIKQFPKIKFGFLSKRTDIEFESDLILSTKDNDWDWQVLSENHKAKISSDLLVELKDKNWNWKAISKRRDIQLSNDTLLRLFDKDWDWKTLSQNENLVFSSKFIEQAKSKPWDWELVSRHRSFVPNIETLSICKDVDLDWEHLSQHSNLNPTRELLSKFEDKWHWSRITKNEQLDFSDTDFLQRFVDRWDWSFICESGNLRLDSQTLTMFKKHLDWDLISANTSINFTKKIIQEFKLYWNWTKLKRNKRVEELLGDYVTTEIDNSATLSFLDKIEQQHSSWKGHIYHFTHIENAVEIIKNRKIQSRNRATIKGDAAGNVVHRRGDAHNYARFYFRPQTPTQFYNEFLGKNTSDGYENKDGRWVSWYEKARGLGFPKCPVPIFFRFSLKGVLFQNENDCCISNGNMQTTSSRFGSIATMINKFGFEDLYYTPQQYATKEDFNRYRNYAQQEFLVKDELSFRDLADFEIVCPSDLDRALLINLLGEEQKDIFSNIVVDISYYNYENPRIEVKEDESSLHISTNYNGDGYFVLNGSKNMGELKVISGDLNSIDEERITFKSNITIENTINQDITLRFIDESKRNWFLYAKGSINQNADEKNFSECWNEIIGKENFNPTDAVALLKQNGYSDTFAHQIRHFKLEDHTVLVCKTFEKHFVPDYSECISLELFRCLLILHDIGKTKAFLDGDKNKQYEHTEQIIKNIWNDLPYSDSELSIILALLCGDFLGEYFQGNLNTKQVNVKLSDLATSCGLPIESFFKIYMIYYQCDIASYTADIGGIRFLEYLFEYKNGKKVFVDDEGLLKMSPKYWEMYEQLKNEIQNAS
jgi:hypothetical protein